jgi:subtilisin family serine protease
MHALHVCPLPGLAGYQCTSERGGDCLNRHNFADGADDANAEDCDGHGTHVASVGAGRTVGVAKEASVVAVKVLGCQGSGSISTVVAGARPPQNA